MKFDTIEVVRVRTHLGLVPGVEQLGDALIDAGLGSALGATLGPVVEAPRGARLRDPVSKLLDVDGMVAVAHRQAEAVDEVLGRERFPLVLGGDDSVLFGSLLALRDRGTYGLAFLDAHTDYYPPADSPTGEASDSEVYLSFGNQPDFVDLFGDEFLVAPAHTILIGHRDPDEIRDTDPALDATDATVIPLAELRRCGVDSVARRALEVLDDARLDGFLIHVDADVLHDDLMPAVDYRLPDGLTRDEFVGLLGRLLAHERAIGLDVTIYNPALDPDRTAARTLADCLVEAFGGPG